MGHRHFLEESRERPESWHKWLPVALLLSVTLALYGTTLYFQFVWDDVVYIQKNYRIQGLSPLHLGAIWTRTYLGHYAPLHHTLLAVLYSLSGGEPFGFHLGQVLLHAICVCLLFVVLKRMESARVALLGCLLFAVHPTNVETVAWISETKSTLAFLFFLLSFWSFLRYRDQERWFDGIFCGIFLILSVLAKINTVVAPAIFWLYDYQQGLSFRGKRMASLGCFFLISAAFVGVHLVSFHGSQEILESSYYGGPGVHLLNLPLLVMFYLRMAIFPHPLSAWQMSSVYGSVNGIVALGWMGLLGMLALLYRGSRNVQFWGLWFLVFLAPVLQVIPFPIWVADRYLYIPAIGMFVLGSKGFLSVYDRLASTWQRGSWGLAMAGVVIAFGWHTRNYLPVWKDDLSLWTATTPTCITSPYCHANWGLSLLQRGQTERGVKELIRAVELRPTPRYLIYLGDAYTMSLGDYRQALIAYRMAQEQGGSSINAEFYGKLARCYLLSGNLQEAARAIEAGKKLNAYDPTLLVMEGFLHWKLGNWEPARQSLRLAFATTGQTSRAAAFLYPFWGRADEVGQLLSDLRSAEASPR